MEVNPSEVIEESYSNCVGCGVCSNICPKRAIVMKKNIEGFLYPKILEDLCIKCNMCRKVCPVLNNPVHKLNADVYAYCSLNTKNWLESTSGGAFSDICGIWEKKYPNSKYYGATMSDEYIVFHKGVFFENLKEIKKSKYVQSSMGKIYKMVKNDLDSGIGVVFSGTPCQVAALRNFLNKNYDNLLLVDVVCHGVGSNDVLKKSINYMEKKIGKKIVKYIFRYKKNVKFNVSHRYNVKYILENGNEVENRNDPFIKLFLTGSCLRESCVAHCKFKACNGYSDITLADLNNKSKIIPKVYDKKNYSAVFFHTDKKKIFINKLSEYGRVIRSSEEKVVEYNKVYYLNNDCKNSRESFFNEYVNEKNFENLTKNVEKRCEKDNIIDRIPYCIKYIINNCKEIIFNGKK